MDNAAFSSRPKLAAAGIATAAVMLVAGFTAIGTSVALLTSMASFGQPSRLVLVAKAPGNARPAGTQTAVALAAAPTAELHK